jgi:site-specific DNA-methyltransferase (adenine-specific)
MKGEQMLDLRNMDCMELMRQYPDKHFDLAIVDPPYGIGASEMKMGKGKNQLWDKSKSWDSFVPKSDYFIELSRVSKSQIIWGGNYFNLSSVGGWIFWDKQRDKDLSFSDGELAWTNFLNVIKKAPIRYDGFIGADNERIHPTQKPVALYRWLLSNYAKSGDLILDTHLGSGSIAIACHDLGFDLVGSELDADYFAAMNERISRHTAQGNLFKPQIEAVDDVRQDDLFLHPAAKPSA